MATFAGDLRRIIIGFARELDFTAGEIEATGDAVMEIVHDQRERLIAFADELATSTGPEAA